MLFDVGLQFSYICSLFFVLAFLIFQLLLQVSNLLLELVLQVAESLLQVCPGIEVPLLFLFLLFLFCFLRFVPLLLLVVDVCFELHGDLLVVVVQPYLIPVQALHSWCSILSALVLLAQLIQPVPLLLHRLHVHLEHVLRFWSFEVLDLVD